MLLCTGSPTWATGLPHTECRTSLSSATHWSPLLPTDLSAFHCFQITPSTRTLHNSPAPCGNHHIWHVPQGAQTRVCSTMLQACMHCRILSCSAEMLLPPPLYFMFMAVAKAFLSQGLATAAAPAAMGTTTTARGRGGRCSCLWHPPLLLWLYDA
jgi:hypothetical protein